MRLLLDTHILLWWLNAPRKLKFDEIDIIKNPISIIFISAASFWEISIKKSVGKLAFSANIIEHIEKNAFLPLPITYEHAQAIEKLPRHHDDPFDRILICQAMTDNLIIITRDKKIKNYAQSCLSQCETAFIF